MNRRKFFSFLATAPVATVIGAKAAMDANGNDVAPLVGDFWKTEELSRLRRHAEMLRSAYAEYGPCKWIFEWHNDWMDRWQAHIQYRTHNSRSQRLRS